ncbi:MULTISPECIES: cysteine rich repeat-containing protein [unclassified Rhizobium]|uniref:cysteine rich repeat-containing protein n=1 Tax=unclassified Rhizobium TaxID=2613769 RepID=UPI001050DE57|nr:MULTISPECIES: cysteine rich repeat-containing protein [unclassified Rhizobium]TCS00934.1 cysteine rich repeat protein [Rhizobium sp. BK418]
MRERASSLRTRRRGRRQLLSGLSISSVVCASLFAGIAVAQAPTEEQKSAIRSACRSDFIAQCSGVQPGGMEALQCLQQHDSTLSAACRKAVSAITVKPKSTSAEPTQTAPATTGTATPAPASGAQTAAQPTEAQRSAVKSACRSDFMAQCSGVTPGGAAALSCLQQHSARLSAPCQQAVAALGASGAPAVGGGSATAAAPVPTKPAAMPDFSPREELMIAREACGPDFRAFCRAVPVGGGRVISCLRDNLQRVSPACHRVLSSGL